MQSPSCFRLTLLVILALVLFVSCAGSASGRAEATTAHSRDGALPQSAAFDRAPAGAEASLDADSSANVQSDPRLAQAPVAPAENAMPTSAGSGQEAEAAPDTPSAEVANPPDSATARRPLLIYEAQLHLAIFETSKVQDAIEQLAKDFEGYLVRRAKQLIQIRVPAERFDEALEQISQRGDVLDRNVTVKDVTEQFLDAEVRLKNARAMRDRLEALLKRANSVTEALQVERELGRITGEIEILEGRLKLLRELVAFSTITVLLSPPRTEQVEASVELPFEWLGELGLGNLLRLH